MLGACMSIKAVLIAAVSIAIGICFSPLVRDRLPHEIRYFNRSMIGMTPLPIHTSVTEPWGYTFEDYYGRDCKNLQGQNALVTGANSGIGFEISKALAKCGVNVTLACRNQEKCKHAAEKILQAEMKISPLANVSDVGDSEISIHTMVVDTSSLASVKTFSKAYLAKNEDRALDMLFFNAGRGLIYGEKQQMKKKKGIDYGHDLILSEDGIEIIFATNYVGHHLMWKYLEPLVKKSNRGRVVMTSSSGSFTTFPHVVATSLEELHSTAKTSQFDMKYYGQSKLAQIMWAKKLARILTSEELEQEQEKNDATSTIAHKRNLIHVNAGHPGAVNTAIWDKLLLPSFVDFAVNKIRKKIMWTSEEGALTLLYLGAATEELRDKHVTGKYFQPQTKEVVNPLALDEKLQDELWRFSEELVADFFV